MVAPSAPHRARPLALPASGTVAGLRRDEGAVSEVVGVVIAIGVVMVLATAYLLMTSKLRSQGHQVVVSGGRASFWSDGYWVAPTGPDPIPVAGSNARLTIDGVNTTVPLSQFSTLSSATTWEPGQRICIVGPDASCYRPSGSRIHVTVYTRTDLVFMVDDLLAQTPTFTLPSSGGIITQQTSQPVRIENIGSAVQCGASGPQIPVTARLTQDGGATWSSLFGGAVLDPNGGESVTIPSVPIAANLGIEARFSSIGGCSAVVRHSVPSDPHALIVRAGDPAPDKPAFASQAALATFMQPFVNTVTQTMVLDVNQVLILFEIVDDTSSSAADFQDLVILITLGG